MGSTTEWIPGREDDTRLELDEHEASLLYRVVRNRLGEVRHDKNSEVRHYQLHKERILSRILAELEDVAGTDSKVARWLDGVGPPSPAARPT